MLYTIILLLTTLSVALITGLWYAYSCSVNPGLGKLPDKEYLMAMQSINRAILNPVFFATFMGTLILLPISVWLSYSYTGASFTFALLLAAALLYAIGVFGVTVACNVPLNNTLDAFAISTATVQDIAALRLKFEQPWNKYHTIRTLVSLICLILVILACLNHAKLVKLVE